MGSFDGTCSVSCLPLGAGDDLRFMLLHENPYAGESFEGAWQPRSFPIRAQYNDYGSIEGYKEDIATQVMVEAMRYDVIERGVGENQCHDVPVLLKDLTTENLLEAIWERRVAVHEFDRHAVSDPLLEKAQKILADQESTKDKEIRNNHTAWRDTWKPEIHVPTLEYVMDRLQKANIPISTGDSEPGKVFVDDQQFGVVRVRESGYGKHDLNPAILISAKATLDEQYATLLVAGTDNPCELLVYPKPHISQGEGSGPRPYRRHGPPRKTKNMQIVACMIREDVWQALLSIHEIDEYSAGLYDMKKKDKAEILRDPLAAMKKSAQAQWEEDVSRKPDRLNYMRARGSREMSFFGRHIGEQICCLGPGSHWDIVVNQVRGGKNIPDKQVERFIQDAAEYAHVSTVLFGLRKVWTPFSTYGEQCGHHSLQSAYYRNLAGVTDAKAAEERKQGEE